MVSYRKIVRIAVIKVTGTTILVIFHGVKCTFHGGEYTFHGGECTFHGVKYNSDSSFTIIVDYLSYYLQTG